MIRNWILKTADFILGPAACYIVSLFYSFTNRSKSPDGWHPESPARILIVRPGGLGDMILLLPAIRALAKAFPAAQLDVICESRNEAVLEFPGLNVRCMPYDSRPVRLLADLMRVKYDIAVDAEQFHMFSAFFAGLSGAAARIGFNINPRRNGIYTHLIPYSPDGFEGNEFLRLLEPLGIRPAAFSPADLRISDPASVMPPVLYKQILSSRGSRRMVTLHAGGSVDRKLWPASKMAQLLSMLQENDNVFTVLLGAPADARRMSQITGKSASSERVLALNNQLSIKECAALISMSDLFVGPDSGLMHLAAACRTPSVAIFGPSDPMKWGYRNEDSIIVKNPPPCAPCFIFGYSKPCRQHQCIEDIPVGDVMQACIQAGRLQDQACISRPQ